MKNNSLIILNKILKSFRTDRVCMVNSEEDGTTIRVVSQDLTCMFICILDEVKEAFQDLWLQNIMVDESGIHGDNHVPLRTLRAIFDFDYEQQWEIDIKALNHSASMARKINPRATIEVDCFNNIMSISAVNKDEAYCSDIKIKNFVGDPVTGPRNIENWVMDLDITKDMILDYINTLPIISIRTQSYPDDPYPLRIKFDLGPTIHCTYIQAPIVEGKK